MQIKIDGKSTAAFPRGIMIVMDCRTLSAVLYRSLAAVGLVDHLQGTFLVWIITYQIRHGKTIR